MGTHGLRFLRDFFGESSFFLGRSSFFNDVINVINEYINSGLFLSFQPCNGIMWFL